MSEGIIPFPPRQIPGGNGGNGPTDPGIGARVARIEEAQSRAAATIVRLEASQVRVEEALARMEKLLERVDVGQRQHGERLSELTGRVGAMEGRLTGIEGRFPFLPTSIQLIGFILSIFVLLGLFRFLEPRFAPAPVQQSVPR